MSSWTENWKGTHANYVKRNKDVKSVVEHRHVDRGEIYTVALEGGGFEVRQYVNGNLHKKSSYPSGVKAVLAYRKLRDELVPNRNAKPTPKATPKASKPKAAAPKKGKPKAVK